MAATVDSIALSPEPPIARRNSTGRRLSGPGRRLSGACGTGGFRKEDIENFFDENDDEKEREAAKKERSAGRAKAKEKKPPRSPFKETPGHQRRKQLYQDAIQMAAEDRVNAQNSWHLDLIDNMGHMLGGEQTTDEHGNPNFQVASTTLDAGVKIYSYRVDSVFQRAFKLVGGLNRSGKGGEEVVDEGAEVEGEEGAEGEKADKKPKISAKKAAAIAAAAAAGTAHLESDINKLNLTKLDVTFDVDPLFHRTSAKFDEGGAKGLLLNNLALHKGTELVFDSTDAVGKKATAKGGPESPASVMNPPIPRSALAELIPKDHASKHVSREFTHFWAHINGTTPVSPDGDGDEEEEEEEEEYVESAPISAAILDGDYAAYEPDASFDDDDDAEAREAEKMLSMREDAMGTDEEGNVADVMDLSDRAFFGGLVEIEEEVEILAPEVAAARGLLSQQAQKLLTVGQRWAGPGHWKFKAPSNAVGGGAGPKALKKEKVAFLIDFAQAKRVAKEVEGEKPAPKGTTTLTQAARAKAKATETTLPHDYHCTVEPLEALFDKPARRVSYSAKKTIMQKKKIRDPNAPFDISDNLTPPSPMPNTSGGEYADDDDAFDNGFGGAGDDDDMEPPAPIIGADGVEMVAQVQRVAKVDIGYAKKAKTVDIKALKEDVWTLLQEEGKKKGKKGGEISFQDVLNGLHKKMPDKSKLEEVSFAYCFICLLHLGNEKTLEITGDGDMKNMKVKLP